MRIAHIITRMIIDGAQENTLLTCLDLRRVYGDEVLLVTGPPLGPEGDLLGRTPCGGLNVVSFDVDGAREVALPGRTGFLAPPQDVVALAEALVSLAGDPSLRLRYGRAGRELFSAQFCHHQMTARIRELYQGLLTNCGRGAAAAERRSHRSLHHAPSSA